MKYYRKYFIGCLILITIYLIKILYYDYSLEITKIGRVLGFIYLKITLPTFFLIFLVFLIYKLIRKNKSINWVNLIFNIVTIQFIILDLSILYLMKYRIHK